MSKVRGITKLLGLPSTIILSLFVVVTVALAAEWADNRMGPSFYVWAPQPANASSPWENGNPKGYREGETAPIAAPVNANANDEIIFEFCLDQTASQSGAFAFTDAEPWNTTHQPTELPDGTPVDTSDTTNWDRTSHPFVWGYKTTILSVQEMGTGGLCGSDYISWQVTFRMNETGLGYIVFGAHIAAPGDPLPYHTEPEVPVGQSALDVNGTFQVRFVLHAGGNGADKTVNFKSNDLLPPPTAVTLIDFDATSGNPDWQYPVLAAGALFMAIAIVGIRKARVKLNHNGIQDQGR